MPGHISAPFVATLADVTGLIIYFSLAFLILKGDVALRCAASFSSQMAELGPRKPIACCIRYK